MPKIENGGSKCPECHADADGATCVDKPGAGPKAEDLSMCLYCGTLLVFNADLSVRRLTGEEWEALDPEYKTILDRMSVTRGRIRAEIQ